MGHFSALFLSPGVAVAVGQVADIKSGGQVVAATPGRLLDVMDSGPWDRRIDDSADRHTGEKAEKRARRAGGSHASSAMCVHRVSAVSRPGLI